mgnify:CR=1 FL=1
MSNIDYDYNYLFKTILLGDAGYGKTSFVNKILNNKTTDNHEPTIGLEFASYFVKLEDKKFKLHIWDTAGQECFAPIIKTYYKNVSCALIFLDVTDENSFKNAEKWYQRYEDNKTPGSNTNPIFICNKIDVKDRKFTTQEGINFAKHYGCKYYEISARTGENCHTILPLFTKHIYKNMNKNFYIEEPGIRKNVLLKLSNTKGKEWRSSCCYIS